jgi:conjugal transfer pilus assembly protein TraB
MISKAKQILKTQKKHALVVASVGLLVLFGIGHLMFQDTGPSLPKKAAKVELPVDKVNVQDIWMTKQDGVLNRLESENKIADQRMKMLEELILSNKKKEEENEKEKLELKKTIILLQQDLKAISSKMDEVKNQEIAYPEPISQPALPPLLPPTLSTSDPFVPPTHSFFSPPPPPSVIQPPPSAVGEEICPLRAPLREFSMETTPKKVFSVDEVVPAAVSVKALLVSSVDAVCGVYANSDPVPVKLRLLDDAHLPKGVTVKLKGCLVLASAYGNISNERVYMRLERLTQVNAKGEAIETDVVGYVSGEDGKFGVRGIVIDRSAKIVKNAAASGFLGGVGQVLQAAVSRKSIDSWNTYSVGTNAAAQGAANGASSAFDMLAEYYIRRAEQVQPVLQVNAGRVVDITFTHGFAMGDLNTKEKIKEIRQKNRRNP